MRKLLLFMSMIISSLFVGIGAFCLGSDDDFRLSSLAKRDKEASKLINILVELEKNVEETVSDNQEQLPPLDNDVILGTTEATNGTGLNLMLINNITTEGYVKDFLAMYLENYNGEYNSNSQHVPLEVVLNAATTEHGFYAGTKIPKYIFPWNTAENAPYYNTSYNDIPASEMSLREATTDTYRKINKMDFYGGIFGITNSRPYATLDSDLRASKRPQNEWMTDAADPIYFPDALSHGDSLITKFTNTLLSGSVGYADLSSDAQIFGMSMTNNRGNNATACMMSGLWHGTNNGTNSRINPKKFVDMSKLEPVNAGTYFNSLITDIRSVLSSRDYVAEISTLNAIPAQVACYYAMAALESGNWYCSEEFINCQYAARAMALFGETQTSCRNKYYRDDLITVIKDRTNTNVKSEDIENAYNIPNGNYNYINGSSYYEGQWYGTSGYIFTVHNARSSIYYNKYSDGSDPFILQSFELSGFMYALNAVFYAPSIYAYMLKYAGVGVDPTNPGSYMQELGSGTPTWVPVSGEDQILIANGLDTSQLTEKRKKIVQAAARLTGISYHQCNGTRCLVCGEVCDGKCYKADPLPSHIDCSAFVWRAYHDAGFEYSAARITSSNFPSFAGFTKISADEAKPGDLIHKAGHVMMYLGHQGTTYYVLEASGHAKPSGYGTRIITQSSRVYTFYRVNGID